MPRAKLSQMATTWVDEEDNSKKQRVKSNEGIGAQSKKKQTFSLKLDTIKRLWVHRIRTSRPISETIDELVIKYIPE